MDWRKCKHQAPPGHQTGRVNLCRLHQSKLDTWRKGQIPWQMSSVLTGHWDGISIPLDPTKPWWIEKDSPGFISLQNGKGSRWYHMKRKIKLRSWDLGLWALQQENKYLYWPWTVCQSATKLPASLFSQKGLHGCTQKLPKELQDLHNKSPSLPSAGWFAMHCFSIISQLYSHTKAFLSLSVSLIISISYTLHS